MADRPNVLFLMCDQMRGDCLSIAGHPDVKTPYLDTLAAEGTLFDHTYSACPSCIPARAGLLTGKAPCSHGRVGYKDGVDWTYGHMMPHEFVCSGYQTALVGKAHVHPPRLGCGFEVVRLHDGYIGHQRRADTPYWMHQDVCDDYMRFLRSEMGPSADVNAAGVENNSWVARPWPYEERLHPTNWVADEAIRFIEQRDRTRPFFLMASFVRPHPPFDAPRDYFDMYLNEELREPAQGEWDDLDATEREGMIMDSSHGCRDPKLRHRAMAGYYACITHMDHQIGRIITALENDKSWGNTIVVFTSDHGEMLFDHGLFRKRLAYEGSAHVPCIVRVGKKVRAEHPALTHHVSHQLHELMDIMPTLLELCDVPAPAGMDGVSFARDVMDGEPNGRAWLHGEHAAGPELSNQWIVTERDKYIWYSQTGIEQYFDLEHDPREETNLIDDPESQERIAVLRRQLIACLENREEGYVENGELVVGRMLMSNLRHPAPLIPQGDLIKKENNEL